MGNFEWETVVHSENNKAGGDAWTTTLNPQGTYYYSSVSHYYFETNYSAPALIKLDLEGNVVAIYDIVNGYINGGLTYAQFINDSILVGNCVYGNSQDEITTLAVLIDTVGNIIDSIDLGPHIQKKVLHISFDNKFLFFYEVFQDEQFDVYLRKLNFNLEDDTLYTMPFTYDSLCPYPIVSDTISQDDCGLIVGVEDGRTIGRYDGKTVGLVLWPNPARTVLSVKVSGLSSGKNYSLLIYDIFGRSAPIPDPFPEYSGQAPNRGKGEFLVDVSSLPSGVYLAVLKDGLTVKASAKFVVVR